jgi:two-component system, OmpR family, sensor histidine kinase MprB
MRFRGTLAARVALLATVAVGLSVALVATAAYLTVERQLLASLDESLLNRATAASRTSTLAELTRRDTPSWVFGAADVRIAVLYDSGPVVYSHDGEEGASIELTDAEYLVAQGRAEHSLRTVNTADGPYRVAAVRGNDQGTALILAQSLEPTQEALGKLGVVLALFGLLGVVGAGVAGWAVARNGLRPVRRLTDAVENIAHTERLEPIAVEGNDEVARLATAFNAMLAGLAASRDRQRRLVADAGHELRTPLTSLRTNLELLSQADVRGGLSAESRAEMMDDVRFQIDELTTLIGDLTELARDEPTPAQLEPVDLAEVAERALHRVKRRATGLTFEVELEPWQVNGEPAALERAVTNLLDNAAKWSPPSGTVTVALRGGTLYVADQGPGIAEEDLPHVFERFYRSTSSRTMPGSGLGLSIVRAVAERHGGAACAGNAETGGAALWFWVPSSDPAGHGADEAGRGSSGAAVRGTGTSHRTLSNGSATESTMDT